VGEDMNNNENNIKIRYVDVGSESHPQTSADRVTLFYSRGQYQRTYPKVDESYICARDDRE